MNSSLYTLTSRYLVTETPATSSYGSAVRKGSERVVLGVSIKPPLGPRSSPWLLFGVNDQQCLSHILIWFRLTKEFGEHINGTSLMLTSYALSISDDYRIAMRAVLTTYTRVNHREKAWDGPHDEGSTVPRSISIRPDRLILFQPGERC